MSESQIQNPKPLATSRVLFLYDPELGHVTAYTRGLRFREMFINSSWKADFVNVRETAEDSIVEYAKNFDLVYLLKVASLSLVKKLKLQTSAKVAFDFTDALWQPFHRKFGWQDLEEILKTCDALYTENEWVTAYGRQFNKNIISIQTCSLTELIEAARPRILPRNDGKLRIGWIGSTGTVQSLAFIRQPLENICRRHPEVELRVIGCNNSSALEFLANIPHTALGAYDEKTMINELLQMDIGIYPPPFEINDFAIRGAQKGLLYMTTGLPVVCQNVGDLARIIIDGENGMLADTVDTWEQKLEALIRSPALRQQIGTQAKALVANEFSMALVFKRMQEAFTATINNKYPNSLDTYVKLGKTRPDLIFSPRLKDKIKILIFHDREGWAWWHRAHQIKRNLSAEFEVTIKELHQPVNPNEYDLVLLFDSYPARDPRWNIPPQKLIVGCSCPKIISETVEFVRNNACLGAVINNAQSFELVKDMPYFYCCQNGVDTDLFYPSSTIPKEWTACWIGNSTSMGKKGLDLILEACNSLDILCNYVDIHADSGAEIFKQEDVRDELYHKSSFYICASQFEGTPNPALEALACGLPVISTSVGNMPEIIQKGYNGFLVERSVNGIKQGIQQLIQMDPILVRVNSRASVEGGWTWGEQVKKYEKMFRELYLQSQKRTSLQIPGDLILES